jgi:hypothetical protein
MLPCIPVPAQKGKIAEDRPLGNMDSEFQYMLDGTVLSRVYRPNIEVLEMLALEPTSNDAVLSIAWPSNLGLLS